MNDWGVIGHDAVVRRLQAAIARGHMAQANLFVGPTSVGKATLARAVARALLGVDERTRRMVDADRHPDVLRLLPVEEKQSLGIDPARAWLKSLTLAPVEGRVRVGIIGNELPLTEEAQNAVLKTLEEPSRAAVMILIANHADEFLSTIVSRCQLIALRPAPLADVAEALETRGVEAAAAARIARLSRGCVGWALRAVADESLLEERDARVAELESLLRAGATERFNYADKLARKKDKSLGEAGPVRAVLGEWILFWRDVAAAYGAGPNGRLRNADRTALIEALRGRLSLAEVRRILEMHTRTIRNIDRNANARLSLDVLLMNLPRLQ